MVRHDGVAIIDQYKSNEAEFKDWLDAETQRHGSWPRSRSGLRSLEEQVQFLSSLRDPVDVPPRSVSHLRMAIQGRQQSQEPHGYVIGVLEWALDVLDQWKQGGRSLALHRYHHHQLLPADLSVARLVMM
ncbi:hypothetical protein AB5N19_07297 [Seiridium cardinale]